MKRRALFPAEGVLPVTVHGAVLYPSVGPLSPSLVLLNLLSVADEDALSFLALLVKHTLLLLQLSLAGTVKVTQKDIKKKQSHDEL